MSAAPTAKGRPFHSSDFWGPTQRPRGWNGGFQNNWNLYSIMSVAAEPVTSVLPPSSYPAVLPPLRGSQAAVKPNEAGGFNKNVRGEFCWSRNSSRQTIEGQVKLFSELKIKRLCAWVKKCWQLKNINKPQIVWRVCVCGELDFRVNVLPILNNRIVKHLTFIMNCQSGFYVSTLVFFESNLICTNRWRYSWMSYNQ